MSRKCHVHIATHSLGSSYGRPPQDERKEELQLHSTFTFIKGIKAAHTLTQAQRNTQKDEYMNCTHSSSWD